MLRSLLRQSSVGRLPSQLFHRLPVRTTSSSTPSPSPPGTSVSSDSALPVDGLPRYPNATTLGTLRLLDYVGTASFAYSGSLLAAASGMDALGASLVGTVTAVGGGTIRDAIIINQQPFWTSEPEYLYLSLLTGGATFFSMLYLNNQSNEERTKETKLEVAVDALGVGAFCVIGAQNGIRAGFGPLVCVLCGMATATFGGVVRDLLCRRKVRILHSSAEIYASTAAGGAAAYLAARQLRAPLFQRVSAGVGLAVCLRAWAYSQGVRLPVWPNSDPD